MKKYLEYFDGAFDSTVADKIKPENKPYVAYSKTEGVVYTVIPEEPTFAYQMVDLGLPSGIKWADRNVGAETPQDNGLYFDWGNVDGHAVDENNNQLNVFNEGLTLEALGPVEIIGPKVMTLRGGTGGTYIRTIGEAGNAKLRLYLHDKLVKEIDFEVIK